MAFLPAFAQFMRRMIPAFAALMATLAVTLAYFVVVFFLTFLLALLTIATIPLP